MAGRLTIIGGGVMGLMTAYHAAAQAQTVTVIDRSQVGDPATASFGLTRSVRNDYRDAEYARLAFEARRLWHELERDCGQRLLVDGRDIGEGTCGRDPLAADPVPGVDRDTLHDRCVRHVR